MNNHGAIKGMSPQLKAVVTDFVVANPTNDCELERLYKASEYSRLALVEAHRALAAAWIRERDAELEVKRAKTARQRLHEHVRDMEAQRNRLCAELDDAEWQVETDRLGECHELCVSGVAHAGFRYSHALKRSSNIIAN